MRVVLAGLALMSLAAPEPGNAQTEPRASSAGRARSKPEEQRRQLLNDLGLKKDASPAPPAAAGTKPSGETSPMREDPPASGSNVVKRAAASAASADAGAGGWSFRRVIHPLLMQGCTPCHATPGPGAATRLRLSGDAGADHPFVSRLVDLAEPTASALLRKPSGAIHGGGAPWPASSDPYSRVLAWIQRGARLDGASAPSDPSA
ncbi:MAG: hypothetical protein ABUS79_06465, partial [Pseudomonadota bacterium]